jgi:hypothetical protein
MFSPFIVKDNFLPDPGVLTELAKKSVYFCGGKEPGKDLSGAEVVRDKYSGSWRGFRSAQLQTANEAITKDTINRIFEALTEGTYISRFHWTAEVYLHYLPECFEYDSSWRHTDSGCIIAGILYLNEHPEENSGTLLFQEKGPTEIENKFNRLVLFDPTIEHCAQKSFGKSVEDARLTLNVFVTRLGFEA